MKFTPLSHAAELNDFVKAMWLIEVEPGHEKKFQEYITFACAYPILTLQYEGEGFYQTTNHNRSKAISNYHYTGLITQPISIATDGYYRLLGISFYPYASHILFNLNASASVNQIFDFKPLFNLDNAAYYDIISDANNPHDLQSAITDCLITLIKQQPAVASCLLEKTKFITKHKGQAPIKELCQHTGYSVRQTERIFKQYLGVCPKEYSNIVRFQHAISSLDINENTRLTEIAVSCGYADQSHFIRDFKKFSNLKPKEYYFNNPCLGIGFIKT